MSRSSMSAVYPRTDRDCSVGTDQPGDLLAALEDEDCRALLQAAAGEALSASELSEACDLPLSTTYRKVDTLTETGLLEERLRISSSGKHTSEYALRVEGVHVSLAGDGVDVTVDHRQREEGTPEALARAD